MSSQDIARRIVKAQEELKSLKATQIIGGDNMGYYEYPVPDYNFTLEGRYGKELVFIFACDTAFPLCSVEFRIYENYKPNPWQGNPAPDGASKDSDCIYTFIDGELLPSYWWADDVTITTAGRTFDSSDPKCVMFMVSVANRTTSTVNVSFRNIRFRTTHPGVTFVDEANWS